MITEIIKTFCRILPNLSIGFLTILIIGSISKTKAYKVNSTGKPTSSSPTQWNYPPENAVDGDIHAEWPIASLFHTLCTDNEPDWWRVDLQEEVISPEVTINFRTDHKQRRNGVRVSLSSESELQNVFCHCVHGAADGSDIADVYHLDCPGRGQFLTISTDTDNGAGQCLDFGEVEVHACSALWYGENCDRACVCVSGESCDPKTGDCFTGSQPAWPDYTCVSHKVNSTGKPTSSSPTLVDTHEYPPQHAVDGNTHAELPSLFHSICSDNGSDWWRVDLQEEIISPEVTIYFRTDYKGRRNGVRVSLSSEPKLQNVFCHCVYGAADGSDIADVYHLDCPGRGQFLTISTDTDNEHGQCLDFGEVEVHACSAMWYGDNCDQACGCGSGESCDPKTGDCFTGSQPAWPNYMCVSRIVDAKGKPTSASSALDLYGHEKAVDGIVSAVRPNVFQTDCTDSASDWWRVDLQEEVISPQVTIYFGIDVSAHGGACRTNEQCVVVKSQCFNNICKCTPGYKYQLQDNSCVEVCATYGESMTLYRDVGISGHDTATRTVDNVEECIKACVTETSFVCLSIDYHGNGCYLQDVGLLDVPSDKVNYIDFIHGNRDCFANLSSSRRNGICVSLSSTPAVPTVFCHCVRGAADGSDIADVYHLNCSGRGQFLTISTDTDNGGGQCLDFGEVEVHACSAMTYGAKCDRVCACNANDSCDPNTGECFTATTTPEIPHESLGKSSLTSYIVSTSSFPLTSSLSEAEMTPTISTPLTPSLSEAEMTPTVSTPLTPSLSETEMTPTVSTPLIPSLSETEMTPTVSTPLTPSLSETEMTPTVSTPLTPSLSETEMTPTVSTPLTPSLSETEMTPTVSTPLTPSLSETEMTPTVSTPLIPSLSETEIARTISTPLTPSLSENEIETSILTPVTPSLPSAQMTNSISTTSLLTQLMVPFHATSDDLFPFSSSTKGFPFSISFTAVFSHASSVASSSHSSTITAETTDASEVFTVTSPTSDTTTTPDPTVLSVDKYGRAVRTKCSCRCKVPSLPTETKAAEEKAVEMKKELVVKKTDLSKTKAKKESKKDTRQSSSVIGQSALVIVVIPVVLILLPDFINVFKGISAMMAKT